MNPLEEKYFRQVLEAVARVYGIQPELLAARDDTSKPHLDEARGYVIWFLRGKTAHSAPMGWTELAGRLGLENRNAAIRLHDRVVAAGDFSQATRVIGGELLKVMGLRVDLGPL